MMKNEDSLAFNTSYCFSDHSMSPIQKPYPPLYALPPKAKEFDPKKAEITLTGQLISIIRSCGGQVDEKTILQKIKPIFPYLRRINGNKYSGSLEKTVIGGLFSSEIFVFENNIWGLREELAQKYENKTMMKIRKIEEKVLARGKNFKRVKQEPESDNEIFIDGKDKQSVPRQKKKRIYKRSNEKYSLAIQTLDKVADYMAEKNYSNLIKNPFLQIRGDETPEEIINKIGTENIIGTMRCYEYFKPLILSKNNEKKKLMLKKMKTKQVSVEENENLHLQNTLNLLS